jgi:glycine betaine/proline transport system substrate-binding protein
MRTRRYTAASLLLAALVFMAMALPAASEELGTEGVSHDNGVQIRNPDNANSQFLEENPAVRKLLEVASIPLDDIFAQNARMFEGEDSEEDLERHAEEWIANNRDQVDQWLEEARAAAS